MRTGLGRRWASGPFKYVFSLVLSREKGGSGTAEHGRTKQHELRTMTLTKPAG